MIDPALLPRFLAPTLTGYAYSFLLSVVGGRLSGAINVAAQPRRLKKQSGTSSNT
jgi:hypothetical protein